MTHLAFTQFMQGRERACAEVAAEALGLLDDDLPWRRYFAPTRARVALELATLVRPAVAERRAAAVATAWASRCTRRTSAPSSGSGCARPGTR